MAHLAPGDYTSELRRPGVSADTVARERARLGLDRPLGQQYVAWLGRLARFDLGTSFRYARPVSELVWERAANTALLAVAALLLATGVGVPLGVVSGSRRAGPVASTIRSVSVVGLSLPPLLTSILLALLAARTGWFPIGGMTSVGSLLSGSFAVEIVASWPGLGRLMYEALISRDVHLVAGCAAIGSLFLACGNLLSDVGLAAADPRLREE